MDKAYAIVDVGVIRLVNVFVFVGAAVWGIAAALAWRTADTTDAAFRQALVCLAVICCTTLVEVSVRAWENRPVILPPRDRRRGFEVVRKDED